jgi:hypothetical protein
VFEGPGGELDAPERFDPAIGVTGLPIQGVEVGSDVVVIAEADHVDLAVGLDIVEDLGDRGGAVAMGGVDVEDRLAQTGRPQPLTVAGWLAQLAAISTKSRSGRSLTRSQMRPVVGSATVL